MLLILDNDSTTLPELVDSLEKLRAAYQIIRYDQPIKLDDYRGIILTGRRSASDEINRANIKVIKQALVKHKPLLGICYGAEILSLAMGGALTRLGQKVYGYQTVYVRKPNILTEPYSRLKVFESHIFNISRLPNGFKTLGYSENCENEIIGHEELIFYGVQFHPECSRDGSKILSNFTKIVGEEERFV
ncbi:MAG: gamma-glutamyl-gamma-aminobutyrate hydrolase family protein [Nitrososphaerales archaeon]